MYACITECYGTHVSCCVHISEFETAGKKAGPTINTKKSVLLLRQNDEANIILRGEKISRVKETITYI